MLLSYVIVFAIALNALSCRRCTTRRGTDRLRVFCSPPTSMHAPVRRRYSGIAAKASSSNKNSSTQAVTAITAVMATIRTNNVLQCKARIAETNFLGIALRRCPFMCKHQLSCLQCSETGTAMQCAVRCTIWMFRPFFAYCTPKPCLLKHTESISEHAHTVIYVHICEHKSYKAITR